MMGVELLMDAVPAAVPGNWQEACGEDLSEIEEELEAAQEKVRELELELDEVREKRAHELVGAVLPVLEDVMRLLGTSGAVREGVEDLMARPWGEPSLVVSAWMCNLETKAAIEAELSRREQNH